MYCAMLSCYNLFGVIAFILNYTIRTLHEYFAVHDILKAGDMEFRKFVMPEKTRSERPGVYCSCEDFMVKFQSFKVLKYQILKPKMSQKMSQRASHWKKKY